MDDLLRDDHRDSQTHLEVLLRLCHPCSYLGYRPAQIETRGLVGGR